MNLLAVVSAEPTPPTDATTWETPAACAGATTTQVLVEEQFTLVDCVEPNSMLVPVRPGMNPPPVIVTAIPPETGPLSGASRAIDGLNR